ncbi:MAG: M16 family metallopeptidase [Candidatus Eiseniibacteriota bacterium]
MRTCLGALAAGAALAGTALAGPSSIDLDEAVREFHLQNGLTLLVVENDESPTIGLATSFAVGAAEERPGVGGVSHILEHMLFKGTTEVGTTDWEAERVHHERIEQLTRELKAEQAKGRRADAKRIEALRAERAAEEAKAKEYSVDNEFDALYTAAGAQNTNAFTSYDATAYILSLPSNRLELWLYLESERLRRPVLRQFYTEVQNVMEERRLRTDADPSGKLQENFLSVAFDAHWYGYPIIGWPSDIESVTRTEADEWFRVYYAPNRMTLAVVGDVDAEDIRRRVEEYFGDIPAQEPPEPMETFDIERKGERRIEVEYDAEPRLVMGWPKKNKPHAEDAALRVVSQVLTGGRSSRLEKRLVEEKQIAASISCDHEYPGERWNNLFFLEALPRAPHDAAALEAAVWEELQLLQRDGITERELAKAKNRIRANEIRELESNLGLAVDLAYAQSAHGDWRVIGEAERALDAVTREDVLAAARATFQRNRTVVATLVEPAFAPDPAKEEHGRTVVDRMVKALGGPEKVAGISSARVASEVSLHVQGQTIQATTRTVFAVPDRVRSEITLFGQTAVECTTPSESWAAHGGEPAPVEGEELAEGRASLEREVFLLAYPAMKSAFVLQGLGMADGLEAVEVRGPTGHPFTTYFDPKTGLPARVEYRGQHPMTGKAAEFVEEFSDFRRVSGVLRPHRIVTSVDGSPFAESTVTEMIINGGVSDDDFVRPQG